MSAAAELYWCDAYMSKVEKANLDGSGRQIIYTRSGFLYGLALDAEYLYLIDRTGSG